MTLQPASNTIGAAGGPSSFGVQTNCSWTATSNASWITVSSPAPGTSGGTIPSFSGTGNGTVPFTAAPNGCVNSQTGTITVTSQPAQTFTLTENGSPGNLTLSPRYAQRAASRSERTVQCSHRRRLRLDIFQRCRLAEHIHIRQWHRQRRYRLYHRSEYRAATVGQHSRGVAAFCRDASRRSRCPLSN